MSKAKDRRRTVVSKREDNPSEETLNSPFGQALSKAFEAKNQGAAAEGEGGGDKNLPSVGRITKDENEDGSVYSVPPPSKESLVKQFGSGIRPEGNKPEEGEEEDDPFKGLSDEEAGLKPPSGESEEDEQGDDSDPTEEESEEEEAPPPEGELEQGDEEQPKAPEDEIDFKEYLANPHNPEKTKKSIKRLLGEISSLKKQIEEGGASKVELEKAIAERDLLTTELETIKQNLPSDDEREELLRLRRLVDAQSDPEITGKYQTRISTAKENILKILKKNGLPEKSVETEERDEDGDPTGRKYTPISVETIESAGGPIAYFTKSPESYRQILSSLDKSNPVDADKLRRFYTEADLATEEMKAEVESATANAKEWYDERRKSEEEAQLQAEQTRIAEEKVLTELSQKIIKESPAFKTLPIPEGATDKQRKEIEDENAFRKELAKNLPIMLSPQSLEERRDIGLAAVAYAIKTRENEKLASEVAKKDEEIAALKKRLKGGSSSGRVSSAPNKTKPREEPNMTLAERIRRAQEQKMRAGRIAV